MTKLADYEDATNHGTKISGDIKSLKIFPSMNPYYFHRRFCRARS